MKHELTDGPEGRSLLRITTDWAEVAADYEALCAQYGNAPTPGFRAGRAPREVIEQRYRRQIREQFTARCGRSLVRQALRERNLRPAGPLAVVEVRLARDREFAFAAECVALPQLVLPDTTAVRLAGATVDQRRDEIAAWLLERTAWDPPTALVRDECEQSAAQSAASDSLEWSAAAKRVKLMVILEQIAEAEGIEVDQRDVDARIEQRAAESDASPRTLRRQLGPAGLSRLESLLRAEQALAYLLERNGARAEPGTWDNQARERTEPCQRRSPRRNGHP